MLSITKDKLLLALRKAVVLVIVYFLQNMLTRIPVMGAVPLLLPSAGVAVALFAAGEWSAGWGLFAGILCDISVGDSPLLFTLTLTIAGLTAGFLTEFYLSRSLTTFFIIALVVNAVVLLLQLVPRVFFIGTPIVALLPIAVAQYFYSVLFIVPIFYFARRFSLPRKLRD